MSSRGKSKTTMAKLSRESRLRERRLEKAARAARRLSDPEAYMAQSVEADAAVNLDRPNRNPNLVADVIDGVPYLDDAPRRDGAGVPEAERDARPNGQAESLQDSETR